jgi:hypothetical protein
MRHQAHHKTGAEEVGNEKEELGEKEERGEKEDQLQQLDDAAVVFHAALYNALLFHGNEAMRRPFLEDIPCQNRGMFHLLESVEHTAGTESAS